MHVANVSIHDFMHNALYHPVQGYYTRGVNFTDPAHPHGRDFTTAPELSPLFGQTLAHWVHATWVSLGQPSSFNLVEAGPGRGTLMRDIFTALPAPYRAAAHIVLVETSPALVELQKKNLAGLSHAHQSHIQSFQHSTIPTLLIANELLDAFPIRQWCGDEERMVMLGAEDTRTFSHPDAAVTREDSPAMTAWLNDLKRIPNIHALLIDYGYEGPSTRDTLQALYRHAKVNPLTHLYEADITAHVPFTQVVDTLGTAQCTLSDMGPFLMRHGLLDIAAPSIHTPSTASALHRFVHPAEMGQLFKVLEYRNTRA